MRTGLRQLLVTLLLTGYLVGMCFGSSSMVLCEGADGHVAVEIAHDCCAEKAAETSGHAAIEHGPCCVDTALSLPAIEMSRESAKSAKPHAAVFVCFVLPLPAATTFVPAVRDVQGRMAAVSRLVALRTVVLVV